jgi:hypothetical protein
MVLMGKPEEERKVYMVLMGKREEKRRENCTWFDGKA